MTPDQNQDQDPSSSTRPPLRCRWVRRRLPLLAGSNPDLIGADRREVERHLIVCHACRARKTALDGALEVLHNAAVRDDVVTEPLWPALERQIHEARHAPPLSPLAQAAAWLDPLVEPLRATRWSRVLAAAAVLLAMAGGVVFWTNGRADDARRTERAAERRIERPWVRSALDPPPVAARPPVEPLPSADATASRFDYDLDHGTPMGPGAREAAPRPSY